MADASVCLLGNTGDGKSSLGNLLFGEEVFIPGHGSEAGTNSCKTKKARSGKITFDIIDTPGLDDPSGRDEDFCSKIVSHLKQRREVGAVLIVVRKRLSTSLQKSLKVFLDMFCHSRNKDGFRSSLGIVFTHWDWSDRAEAMRENGDQPSTTALTREFNNSIRAKLPKLAMKGHNFPCFFVNCIFEKYRHLATDSEILRQDCEKAKIMKFIFERSKTPVNCLSLRDVLKEEKEKEEAEAEKAGRELEQLRQFKREILSTPSTPRRSPPVARRSGGRHDGPRCKDGSLDMRFNVNKGRDKYLD